MDEDTIREGGCECGSLRYRVRGAPIMVHCCHCHKCQRQTGSTGVVNGFWEDDRFTLLAGKTRACPTTGGSGRAHTICRCRECGTAVWSHYGSLGTLSYGVRVGTLDAPGALAPDVVLFTESKPPWVPLPDGVPAFEAYYDFRDVLPPDRQGRLLALAARRKAGEG